MKVNPSERTLGVGEYYFSSRLREIGMLNRQGAGIINLGVGNPDLAPHPSVSGILAVAGEDISVHGYQPYRGIDGLRDAFSRWYNEKFGVSLSADNEILPLMGSKEGIMLISLAFLNKGDAVLIPDPGYPAYEAAARICGGRPLFYDLEEKKGWFPDLDMIEERGLEGVKMMWVNYPNMPTGSPGSRKLFRELTDFGHRHNILIINDNPYSLILNNDPVSIFQSEGPGETALELNSLSKSHNMAGWRIGVVTGNRNYIDSLIKIKSNMDSGMFLPLQLAAIQALSAGNNWYHDLNAIYGKRREKVFRIARMLGCSYNTRQSGMFVWASIPDWEAGSVEFSEKILQRYGIFITPGQVFGANGSRYVRISLCASTDLLENCIERITEKKTIRI